MTRSMTRNQNSDKSSRKRKNTWSDISHDVIYSVMMQLGVVEFVSFSGVCESWRSLALSNRNMFMASKPPMSITISSTIANEKECYFEDFKGRKFKTILPDSADRTCIGVTSGYLIFFSKKTRDFWCVNPITRHELLFPDVPFDVADPPEKTLRSILVFSPSINGWVFAVVIRTGARIWYSIIAGKRAWNHVSSDSHPFILDVHAFKGKIYTLNYGGSPAGWTHVCELTLKPVPKLTSLNTLFLEPLPGAFEFIRSDENLYLIQYSLTEPYRVHKLDFDKLNWVRCCEKTGEENVIFYNGLKHIFAVKPESWGALSSQSGRFFGTYNCGKGSWLSAELWYFPHDCVNVTRIQE